MKVADYYISIGYAITRYQYNHTITKGRITQKLCNKRQLSYKREVGGKDSRKHNGYSKGVALQAGREYYFSVSKMVLNSMCMNRKGTYNLLDTFLSFYFSLVPCKLTCGQFLWRINSMIVSRNMC